MELRASAAGAVAAAALASVVALWWCGFAGPPSSRHEPPSWDADRLFRKLDADRNGLLDRLEFGNFPDAIAEVESEERRDGEVIIKCSFTPLLLSSMESELSVASVAVKGLLDWREPARSQASYSHEIFANFMKTRSNEVGTIWYMIQPDSGSSYENKFSNFRYAEDPQTVPGPELTFFHLLSMFHENVFLQTRFHPRGTVAMLQAKTSELFLIIFRCHAEFQLNSPPLLPFWFTPGQFRGQIIISRDRSKVFYFHLEVPSTKKLNVDMEWMNEQNSSLEVDIGYLPEMKLELKEQQLTPSEVKWDQQISDEDAEDMLEKAMFPFKEVKYHPIKEAVVLSQLTQKPLHCIVLWGVLDDQSC
ncbi:selenoprotein N-like [Schistocerca cancellata]|uniref:selenoprotein N-like n=1 Tax=Schistocerca cancellata TaxID=274614 RepID=UPI002118C92E|nr:selenoprotein N-like [Schistocerca cancellata]